MSRETEAALFRLTLSTPPRAGASPSSTGIDHFCRGFAQRARECHRETFLNTQTQVQVTRERFFLVLAADDFSRVSPLHKLPTLTPFPGFQACQAFKPKLPHHKKTRPSSCYFFTYNNSF
jgi:hypothetical protein